MQKIFVVEFYVEYESKQAQVKLGCNKEEFKKEDLSMIESLITDLSKLICLAHIKKAEEGIEA